LDKAAMHAFAVQTNNLQLIWHIIKHIVTKEQILFSIVFCCLQNFSSCT